MTATFEAARAVISPRKPSASRSAGVNSLAINAANWDGTPQDDRISLGEVTVAEEPCPPPVRDLAVRLAPCEPTAPGEARLELSWLPSGAPFVTRAADAADLVVPPETWADAGGDCLALDPRPLVFYSVSEECDLGSEGPH